MRPPGLSKLVADAQRGVEGRRRTLGHQAYQAPANRPHFRFPEHEEITAEQFDASAEFGACMIQQPQNCESECTLSGTAFANQAGSLACMSLYASTGQDTSLLRIGNRQVRG
jgi:hypothetical protein